MPPHLCECSGQHMAQDIAFLILLCHPGVRGHKSAGNPCISLGLTPSSRLDVRVAPNRLLVPVAEPQGCFSPPNSILPMEPQLQNRSDPELEGTRQSKLLSFPPPSADFRQQYLSCRVAAEPQLRPMIIIPYVGFKTFPISAVREKQANKKNLTKKTLQSRISFPVGVCKPTAMACQDTRWGATKQRWPSNSPEEPTCSDIPSGSISGSWAAWTSPHAGDRSYSPRAWKPCWYLW